MRRGGSADCTVRFRGDPGAERLPVVLHGSSEVIPEVAPLLVLATQKSQQALDVVNYVGVYSVID